MSRIIALQKICVKLVIMIEQIEKTKISPHFYHCRQEEGLLSDGVKHPRSTAAGSITVREHVYVPAKPPFICRQCPANAAARRDFKAGLQ